VLLYKKDIFEKSGTELEGLEGYKRVKTTSAIWIIMNTEKPNLTQVLHNGRNRDWWITSYKVNTSFL
jgi:hypothetical protein